MKGTSLELYRVFREIGKTGNLTHAAKKLYVSQPNISAALKALEEQLNTTLCVRTKKGINMTYEGQVLFDELEKAFSHIALAERRIEKLVHLESGIISISASDTICNYYLLPYISGQVDFGFINLPFEDNSADSL